MVTQYFRITDPETQREEVAQAAAILREGGLLGIPTETVYGLGANGLNTDAVNRIFLAKGRPQDNPLILHIPGPRWSWRPFTTKRPWGSAIWRPPWRERAIR